MKKHYENKTLFLLPVYFLFFFDFQFVDVLFVCVCVCVFFNVSRFKFLDL